MMSRFAVLLAVALAGCSSQDDAAGTPEGQWARAGLEPWSLHEELRIGRLEGDGPEVFGRVRNVLADSRGQIWILDAQAYELRLFAADGTFLRAVGGRGEGPGEFSGNVCALYGPEGEVWVEEGGRYQRFDLDGKLIGIQRATRSFSCAVSGWRGEEFIAVTARPDPYSREFVSSFLVHDLLEDGSVVVRDTLASPQLPDRAAFAWVAAGGRTVQAPVPFSHRPGYWLTGRGELWSTDGDGRYAFRKITLEGDTITTVERSLESYPVPGTLRLEAIEALDREGMGLPQDFDESLVPDVFPPFDRIIEATDGSVWVQRRVTGGEPAYDVFDEHGQLLGTVEVPAHLHSLTVHTITSESIYGVVRDDMDVQYVVRVGIAKERP